MSPAYTQNTYIYNGPDAGSSVTTSLSDPYVIYEKIGEVIKDRLAADL